MSGKDWWVVQYQAYGMPDLYIAMEFPRTSLNLSELRHHGTFIGGTYTKPYAKQKARLLSDRAAVLWELQR